MSEPTPWWRRPFLRRSLLLTGILLVVGYNVYLSLQTRYLKRLVDKRSIENIVLQRQIEEDERALLQGWEAYRNWLFEHRQLREELANATSRVDFPVREGNRVAFRPLTVKSSNELKLGLYVPAGRHRLRLEIGEDRLHTASRFQETSLPMPGEDGADDSLLGQDDACELGPEAEVYEIVAEQQNSNELLVTVVGPGEKKLHQWSVTWYARPGATVIEPASEAVCYPSEVKWETDDVASSRKVHLPRYEENYAVDLATIKESLDSSNGLRLKLESEARPCMSAMELATRIRIDAKHGIQLNSPAITRVQLKEYFEPYDGGEVLFFKDAAIVQPASQ